MDTSVLGPGICGNLPRLYFWYVSFQEILAIEVVCFSPTPTLSTHIQQGDTTNHGFQRKGPTAPPTLLLSFLQSQRCFPSFLKEGPLCFPLPAEVILWMLADFEPSCFWSLIILHGINPRSSCLGYLQCLQSPSQATATSFWNNSSWCQSRTWIVCCHQLYLLGRAWESDSWLLTHSARSRKSRPSH